MKTDIKAPLNTVEAFISYTLVFQLYFLTAGVRGCLTVSTSFFKGNIGCVSVSTDRYYRNFIWVQTFKQRGDENLRDGRMTLSVVLARSLEIFYWLVLVSRDTEVTNWSAAAPSQILKKQNEVCFSLRLSCGAEVEGSHRRL